MDKDVYIKTLKNLQSKLYEISIGEDDKNWYEKNSAYVNNTANKINKFIITSGSKEEYIDTFRGLEKEAKKINDGFVSKMNLEGNLVKVKPELVKPLNIVTKYSTMCFENIKANFITNKSGILDFLAALFLAICIRIVARIIFRIVYVFILRCIGILIMLLKKLFGSGMSLKRKYSNVTLANEVFKVLKKYKTQIGYGFLFGSMACLCLLISSKQDDIDEIVTNMIDLNWLKKLVDSIKDKVYISE